MTKTDPTNADYLAIVSEWSSYGQQSASRVGNAYPVLCLSDGQVVENPMEEFPNPGYIFLVNRGELTGWDYVRVRPVQNARYKHANPRECYYIARSIPQKLDAAPPNCSFAVLLDVPTFDPNQPGAVLRNAAQNVTPWFFVRSAQGKIFGPLRRLQVSLSAYETLDSIQWAPWREDSFIYEFTPEGLKAQGVRLEVYRHPEPDLNEVVNQPLHLLLGPVLAVTSNKVHDRLSDSQLAEWYLRWRDLPEVPEPVLKTFRTAAEHLGDASSEIIRQRCRRLVTLLMTLDVLQAERRIIARRYLESDDGKKAVEQQLALEIERRAQMIEEEVKKRRSELAEEQQRLAFQLRDLQEGHRQRERALTEEVKRLEGRHTQLQEAMTALESDLRNGAEKLAGQLRDSIPLLAVLTPAERRAPSGTNDVARPAAAPVHDRKPTWAQVKLPEPTKLLEDVKDESALIDRLAAELTAEHLAFSRDFLANLYVCLKSSSLNLITGPPGHGKSSVVAALARTLGHGNALLEIAVRRSWSDDRYLLGFYDTFHGRYDSGPTGLATRLLQAQRDWEKDKQGLYLVLLDEFNLAAPEYYFSQLLQLVTRPGERVLQLFDPAALPPGSAESVHQVRLHPNVSFWGTINYDETTERLSPRLLDRTGMIFLTARDIVPAAAAEGTAMRALRGVRAGSIVQRFVRSAEQCPEELWDMLEPLLDLLRKQTEERDPGIDLSPRVIDAIKRYLANSKGLLGPTRAVDFVFQQRVLPSLRGRGPQFAARIKLLLEKLTEKGLERSARHVRDALALADAHFGDVDFLAY